MPSAKILEQKVAETAILTEKLKTAAAGVLVNYKGITVEQDTKLRSDLRAAGVEYKVYKNTMTKRACEDSGYGDMSRYLDGMNALAVCQKDPVVSAKILTEYAEKIPTFEVVCGFVEKKVIDADGVTKLAKIPSKETLICKIMLGMKSPLYKLAYVLQAKIDLENAANNAAPAPAEAAAE